MGQRFFVVPHTHWDREWYRPLEHFRLLLGGIVDQVIDTLESDPDFTTFTLDGQAIVLEDYLEVRPENEARLRALIAAGRIEIGPSYVLPDEFLVGGEALVRNLLIGRAVCEHYGGRPSAAGYLPDSFGHPAQLPQILAGFGIDSFLFTRGMGDELDEVGVVFDWVAPDGSSVRAIQQLPEYGNFHAVRDADDGQARVAAILERFGPALARAGVSDVLLCNGTDHLPIQPEMPALCAELQRRSDGDVYAIARYDDYVAQLRTGTLPCFRGELLGSRLANVLRGVNSARLYLKQANERAEQRLLAVETLAALSALRAGAAVPQADFTFAWRELLKCQPHDSICGCSCDEVHRDMLHRYASLHRTLDLLTLTAGGGLPASRSVDAVAVFNPLPFARSGVVQLDGTGPTPVALEGFESRVVTLAPAAAPTPRDGDRIENDRFTVSAGTDGTLTIDDRASGRRFAGLHAVQDETDIGDLYNFCPAPGAGVWRATRASTRILSEGPVCSELQITYHGELCAGVDAEWTPLHDTVALQMTTVVRLVAGSDRVEFVTTIDNTASDHRLRVSFPIAEASGPVRAEGQFAVLARPIGAPVPRAQWREPPDPTGHAIGVSALGEVALLTRGLPEYEARSGEQGAELCLTLLRCVGVISRAQDAIPTRPVCAGPPTATAEGQCHGRHVLEYALRFDADALSDAGLLRASQDYRAPWLVSGADAAFSAPLTLEGDVVFSCLKGAQDGDGVILRVFNPARTPAGVSISASGPVTVTRARLDETGATPVDAEAIEVGAGAIATLRLT